QDHEELGAVLASLRAGNPTARMVIGGPICWSFDQAGDIARLAPWDHVVIGDGEGIIADLLAAIRASRPLDHLIRVERRFDIALAKPLYWPLVDATWQSYYGAVLEVSRGCPFLCEFCDIRILPDNNRPHNKPVDTIMAEIDHLAALGVNRFLLACDNFIGEPRWAESLVDAILAWRGRTGRNPTFYTWLTINLYKMPWLLRKLRQANFDAIFIGVESFNANSLLETAKVQNAAAEIVEAVRLIQSYGFPVIAGLIFGFDSDTSESFDQTLDGIAEAGLLSGDPSLLTALPGTPLYQRMKAAGRLRDVRYGLGGYKYRTNIRYLLPRDAIISGYIAFNRRFSGGRYQFRRLRAFFDNLDRGNYIPITGDGYISYSGALRIVLKDAASARQLVRRLTVFSWPLSNWYWLLRAVAMVAGRRRIIGRFGYLKVWFTLWTNVLLRYADISERDFDIDSVADGFDLRSVLPGDYIDASLDNKTRAQRRLTAGSLEGLVRRSETGE
ncbi:MAG: B12-binding domain-containing radical SAM protein, partial [Magnetospirillum sp.]